MKPERGYIRRASSVVARADLGAVNELADLAICRLQLFDPDKITEYPIFRAVEDELPAGRSLCRLGFPFHDVRATFDEATKNFTLAANVFPMPRFPSEGMLTRNIVIQASDQATAKFIETSTPGLGGQSGGPIFDTAGHVWGIQSRTNHMNLGFSPTVKKDGRDVTEHQFLNVGIGVHVAEIAKLLTDLKVRFRSEP